MTRLLTPLVAVFVLLAAACGGDDDDAAPTTTETVEETTTTDATTTTSTTAPDPTADWTRCANPDGFRLSYPQDWSTNDGSVVGECSQFDPEPFTVPEATDERVAAITAYVDPVPYAEVAAPGDEVDRAVTTVDGHQAVRIEEVGSELYGEDTATTRYLVDLPADGDAEPSTLFLDTIELRGMAYEQNVEVLDRMVRTIEIDIGGSDVAGWVLPLDPAEVSMVTFSDIAGTELGTRTLEEEVDVEPVGSFQPPPVSSGDFPATGTPPAYLADVRVAGHDGFDRVVFEFVPGEELAWEVEATDEVRATSGQVVEVEGEAILRVTMSPASGVDLTGSEPEPTYTGPDRMGAPGAQAVTEVVAVEDFENVSTWAIGTDGEGPIAAQILPDPLRLVIDVEA